MFSMFRDVSLPHLIWTHEGGTQWEPQNMVVCMYKPQILSISLKLSRVLTTTEKTLGFVLLSRKCSNRKNAIHIASIWWECFFEIETKIGTRRERSFSWVVKNWVRSWRNVENAWFSAFLHNCAQSLPISHRSYHGFWPKLKKTLVLCYFSSCRSNRRYS